MRAQARNGVFAVAGVAALCVFHACVIRCGAPAYGGVLTAAAALVLIWLPGCFCGTFCPVHKRSCGSRSRLYAASRCLPR